MLRLMALSILLLMNSFSLADDQAEPRKPTLEEVRRVPVGLKITHTPAEVRAVTGAENGIKYTWPFRTTVTALDEDVTILYFSCFIRCENEWVHGKVFSAEEFAEWYGCPGGIVRKGESVSDPQNWNADEDLVPGKVIWYFIAKKKDGTLVQGEAEVSLLAKLSEEQ